MLNIGEISKPTVDRAEIKKSRNVDPTDPIIPAKEVSDMVELSEESRHRYEEELEKHHSQLNQSEDSKELNSSEVKRIKGIDVSV